jgi:hypothetical protein
MPFRNFTAGTNAEASVFFTRLAPIAMDIAGGHQLPITIMNPGIESTVIQATAPVSFSFLDGVEILNADYTQTMGAPAAATYANSGNTCGGNIVPCVVTAIEKGSALEGKVSLMPNPTSGNLNVDLTKLKSAATITVSDVMGKILSTTTNQTGNVAVDLTTQAAGIYFVTIQNAEGKLTAKIAVAR